MRPGLLLASLLATPVLAQAVRWQLPERGGALYRRSLKVESKVTPDGAWTPEIWTGEAQPGTMLVGELDAERLRRSGPLWDLRELLAQIGLDLGTARAGKSRLEIATAGRFQPTRIDATHGAIAADGQQTFTATIEFDAKAARNDGTPFGAPRLLGRVEGTRVVDRAKGLVARFSGSAALTLDFPPFHDGERQHPARRQMLHITDEWADPVVLSVDDAGFKGRVTAAIRGSIGFLRAQLGERLGTPFEPAGDPYHDIQPGELALMLLALRHGGEDARDPLLQRSFDRLRRRVMEDTYSLAVAILAVESLYTPPNEWSELRTGRLKAPLPRALSAADLELVRGWTKALLDNIDTSVDAAIRRGWSYGPAKGWDNSNTQYALLGLYGAQLCGVEVGSPVWTAAANHWLECAIPIGPTEVVDLVYHRDIEKGTHTRTSAGRVQPRAWSYGAADEATGSMTAAGIGGLTLCSSALRLLKRGGPELLADIDDAVRGGFLWLQHELTVRRSAGPIEQSVVWHLYYLYGLERACELNGIARIGGRDWYFEGALHLIATQALDGSWGSSNDTAFGLLFLKKAALPAITGR